MAEKEFVGVDVSKQQLAVAVRPSRESWSESNEQPGVRRLVKRLSAMQCTLVVIEGTDGYQNLLAAALRDSELPVQVVNPRWVRDFVRAHGQPAKTDKLDAKLLALYAERTELELRVIPDEQTLERVFLHHQHLHPANPQRAQRLVPFVRQLAQGGCVRSA